jgi:voltage-gated potassium channel Kch
MATIGIACLLLLVFTTVIHFEMLRTLSIGLPRVVVPGRAKLIVVIFGAFLAHAAEIALYALAVDVLVRHFDLGTLGHAGRFSFNMALYFSAETYTSLGYGDVVPSGPLRLLAGVEALNGLLLIGWSASYVYIAMERFWGNGPR